MNDPVVIERAGVTARLWLGDCLEIAPALEGLDAVITDPPFGIGFASQPTMGGRFRGQKAEIWDETAADIGWIMETNAAQIVIWGGNYFPLPISRGWLCWFKPDAPPSMGEFELAWTNQDQNTRHICHSIAATNGERVGHPTQKPYRVMAWCMDQVGVPIGATVCDPYMGSATTGLACIRTGRNFIGIEKDPKHFATACERIQREANQGVLL
jgi:site-specific DNA-methyltransferase (adenine-specific)